MNKFTQWSTVVHACIYTDRFIVLVEKTKQKSPPFCPCTHPHMHGCLRCLILKISLMFDITSVGWDKLQSFTKMRPLQKQCQSPSIQCAGIRYPRSSEHPLIQSSLFTGGQVATLNGLFHGQTGHLPNIANTKASERQIFNWSTSALQRQYHPVFS